MSNVKWPKKPLSALTSKIGDGIHGTPVYVESGGYPFVNGNNLKQGAIVITNDTKRVDKEEFDKYFIEFDKSTLFMSINGTLGSLAKYNDEEIILGKSAAYIKCKNINIDFLYYYLQLKEVQNQMWNIATGSTIKNLSLGSIRDLEVSVPSNEIQKNIAKILSTLDAKIELNNRINAELEAMAKTLYDYWFVQFDFPFDLAQGKPAANGKPYKSSGGKMVYNPILKREIPVGWNDSTIGEIEPNIVTGKTPSTDNSEYFEGEIPFITIGDIRDNTFIVDVEQSLSLRGANTQNNKFLPEGTICVTCIASPGLVGIVTRLAQTNQQINSVICANDYDRYFLYFAINDYFKGARAKTGNTFANMNKGDFTGIPVLKPRVDVLELFHANVNAHFELVKTNSIENSQLKKLRDWLLPMLMSGQVTVK